MGTVARSFPFGSGRAGTSATVEQSGGPQRGPFWCLGLRRAPFLAVWPVTYPCLACCFPDRSRSLRPVRPGLAEITFAAQQFTDIDCLTMWHIGTR